MYPLIFTLILLFNAGKLGAAHTVISVTRPYSGHAGVGRYPTNLSRYTLVPHRKWEFRRWPHCWR